MEKFGWSIEYQKSWENPWGKHRPLWIHAVWEGTAKPTEKKKKKNFLRRYNWINRDHLLRSMPDPHTKWDQAAGRFYLVRLMIAWCDYWVCHINTPRQVLLMLCPVPSFIHPSLTVSEISVLRMDQFKGTSNNQDRPGGIKGVLDKFFDRFKHGVSEFPTQGDLCLGLGTKKHDSLGLADAAVATGTPWDPTDSFWVPWYPWFSPFARKCN